MKKNGPSDQVNIKKKMQVSNIFLLNPFSNLLFPRLISPVNVQDINILLRTAKLGCLA